MKAVAINGSPRKGGNTETLLLKVLEPLKAAGWQTGFIQVGAKNIRGCSACFKCFDNKDKQCAMKNDIFNDCMQQILEADAVILGSPTYFTDVSAEMKALLDRTGMVALANDRVLCGKIGAAVVAVRRGGATHVFDTINHMFFMSGMVVPGSTYWNMGFGLDKGQAGNDEEGINNMINLGEAIAWLGKAIQPHLGDYPGSAPGAKA